MLVGQVDVKDHILLACVIPHLLSVWNRDGHRATLKVVHGRHPCVLRLKLPGLISGYTDHHHVDLRPTVANELHNSLMVGSLHDLMITVGIMERGVCVKG